MGPADEIEIVSFEEVRYNVGTEGERHPTIIFAPALNLLIGVGPQQIAEQTYRSPT